MKNKVTVDVFIPCYNNEKTLSKTLDSLLNQSFKDMRITIVNNASTDKSLEVAESYQKRTPHIKIFSNPTNLGGEGNFNKCIELAEGKYTAIFHADDTYDKDIISKQVEALESHPELSVVLTQARMMNLQGKIVGQRFLPKECRSTDISFLDFDSLFCLILKYGNFFDLSQCSFLYCHIER